jgi:hypothetical protein
MRILLESLAVGGLLLTGAALQWSRATPTPAAGIGTSASLPVAATRAASPAAANHAALPGVPSGLAADRPGVRDAVYAPGSQFTARLDQTRNHWQLLPLDGGDVDIDAGACSTGFVVPTGVWLLVPGSDGKAELVAPSATHVPAGSPDRVALRSCSEATGQQVAVPRSVLDLLAANTGAVYVDP